MVRQIVSRCGSQFAERVDLVVHATTPAGDNVVIVAPALYSRRRRLRLNLSDEEARRDHHSIDEGVAATIMAVTRWLKCPKMDFPKGTTL